MDWHKSFRCDDEVRPLADRHYNRQKIGAKGFVPPGRCLVLKTQPVDAFWVTSYPFAEYVRHQWAGAFVCSAFRNEGNKLSSELIRQAVSCTISIWNPPPMGMITFVNKDKVKPKQHPGFCFLKAGFRHVGETKGGLLAFQMLPHEMPPPMSPMDDLPKWLKELLAHGNQSILY
jgi:hypothetical protein